MKFKLAQSFEIDGELGAWTKELVFTLGVEWGMVFANTKHAGAFQSGVHEQNIERVSRMLTAQGRKFTVSQINNGFAFFSVTGLD